MKKILYIFLISFIFTHYVPAAHTIWVYGGEGANPESLNSLISSIRAIASNRYTVETIDHNNINAGIDDSVRLLVFPGGRATPFREKLRGTGIDNIRDYVRNRSGKYMGFGAGAYFASQRVYFYSDEDSKYRVVVENQNELLGFYNADSKGPAFKPYDGSPKHALLAEVELQSGNKVNLFCNGGGYFEGASKKGVSVMGKYVQNGESCIIGFPYGKGRVALTHVHPEYQAEFLKGEYEKTILDSLWGPNQISVLRSMFHSVELDVQQE